MNCLTDVSEILMEGGFPAKDLYNIEVGLFEVALVEHCSLAGQKHRRSRTRMIKNSLQPKED